MRSKLTIELSNDGGRPIFLQLVDAVRTEIERGRLKPGERLPGTRALGKSLGLNRNTINAAFSELALQGWIETSPSSGTFVSKEIPTSIAQTIRTTSVYPAATSNFRKPALNFSDGAPDPRLLPRAELAQSFRRALASPAFLSSRGYGDPRGSSELRAALSEYLAEERGIVAPPTNILVTRGSQMALFLAANALLSPGETIAVENPGYPLAWTAFRAAGARIVGVNVDSGGMDVDHLAELAGKVEGLRAVYVTPHHQYPTTVTMGAARRLKLLEVCQRASLTIIEDDYDHEYRYEGRPIMPLVARGAGGVPSVYVGSLSKLLAPGLRVGYALAEPSILQRMCDRREAIDRQGDIPLEHALASILAEGAIRRHTKKARRLYMERRDILTRLLEERFPLGEFEVPAGGLAIWLRLNETLSAETLASRAAALGLSVMPGVKFALDPLVPREALRLGFASLTADELHSAVELLARSAS